MKSINEATTSGGSGHFKNPINLAPRIWDEDNMGPFNIPVSKYLNPELAYDSYDGKLDVSKNKAKKVEKMAKKIAVSDKIKKQNQDDDGLGGGRPSDEGGGDDGDSGGLSENYLNKIPCTLENLEFYLIIFAEPIRDFILYDYEK